MRYLFSSNVTRIAGVALAVAALGTAASAPAAEKAPAKAAKQPAGKSLDDELLENLDNELLDDAGQTPGKKSPPKAQAKTGKNSDDEKPVIDGEDIGAAQEDPLSRVGRQMRAVEGLIERLKSAEETTERQQRIVSELDKIIEQLEQQCNCKKSGGEKNESQKTADRQKIKQPTVGKKPGDKPSDKPPKDSSERLGKDELKQVDMEQMKGLLKDLWGQLPLRDREQMLQTSPEQFLPKYELLIEKYYKRLADQQKNKE